MSTKDYKKGIRDQAEVDAQAHRATADALDRLGEQYYTWTDRAGRILDFLIAEQEESYRARELSLEHPYDPSEMEETERRLLIGVLFSMPRELGFVPNLLQQTYFIHLKWHLRMGDISVRDFSGIGRIEYIRDRKAFLLTVMEYLALGSCDHSYFERYRSFFDLFELNKAVMEELQAHMDEYVAVAGPCGLAQKFSYGQIPSADGENKKQAEPPSVLIVYDKEDKGFAKKIKHALTNVEYSCTLSEQKAYDQHHDVRHNYYLFVSQNQSTADLISTGRYTPRLDVFGCCMLTSPDSKRLMLSWTSEIEKKQQEAFISYFLETCQADEKIFVSGDSADLELRKRNKRKEKKQKADKNQFNGYEKFLGNTAKPTEFLMEKANGGGWKGVLSGAAVLPTALLSLLVAVGSLPVALLCGLSSSAVRDLVDRIRDSGFKKKFVAEAQRDILLVSLIRYMTAMEQKKEEKL